MFDLTDFTLRDMTACGAALRRLGAGASNLEAVAEAVTRYLFENLTEGRDGAPACVLVRFFMTFPYAELRPEQQAFARRLLAAAEPSPRMKCLTLLASAGVEPHWNDPAASAGHRAIPLPSAELVGRMPMISQLLQQFGLEARALLQADPDLFVDQGQRADSVFHVPDALGSPYVPGQEEFVKPYGVRSVVGFGGLLPPGELFAVILFARVTVARETAELFKPLAPSTKLALLPFVGNGGPADAATAGGAS